MSEKQRKILVTTALPYANGSIHLGHLLETIQADIWVRYHRSMGRDCFYICADDTHGTPIMLKAKNLNISPEALIEKVYQEHKKDYEDFLIGFDDFYTTHSQENQVWANNIYQKLNDKGLIIRRNIQQLYDEKENMFLPDRFVKGQCPKCEAQEQYGDNCEQCGASYSPTDLVSPYSVLSNTTPIVKESEHYFFDLPQFEGFLQEWIDSGVLQPQVTNKLKEWFVQGLKQWDISRDKPYFGFPIPNTNDEKYFYVWLDAPIGYISAFEHYSKTNQNITVDDFWHADSTNEVYHFIGKDIIYFHSLFWPAMLNGANLRTPTNIFVHGYVNIQGEKLSKSRGLSISARTYLEYLDPEYLRYYYASKLSNKIVDIDFNFEDFVQKINADLVGKLVNIASRTAGFVNKKFNGYLVDTIIDDTLLNTFIQQKDIVVEYYENLEYAKLVKLVMNLADQANAYIADKAPWILAKDENQRLELHQVVSIAINLFRILIIYLQPILVSTSQKVEDFLNTKLDFSLIEKPLTQHKINVFKPLISRIDMSQVEKLLSC